MTGIVGHLNQQIPIPPANGPGKPFKARNTWDRPFLACGLAIAMSNKIASVRFSVLVPVVPSRGGRLLCKKYDHRSKAIEDHG